MLAVECHYIASNLYIQNNSSFIYRTYNVLCEERDPDITVRNYDSSTKKSGDSNAGTSNTNKELTEKKNL